MDLRRFCPVLAVFSAALAGCSGTAVQGSTSPDTGNPLRACSSQSAVSATEIPPVHRALAAACAPTPPDANFAEFSYGASGTPCTSDAQCGVDGGLPGRCLRGACSIDECLTDDDCGGGVCVCSNPLPSNVLRNLNRCVHGNCRIDGDCGTGGYCVPSGGLCSSAAGFFCHTAADTCVDPAIDCPSSCIGSCTYFPDRGGFACVALTNEGC